MDVTGPSRAQGGMPIIDGDLRHCAKQEFAEGPELRQWREHDRHDTGADDISEPALRRSQGEYPIRCPHQAACESDTLGLVGVQQCVRRATGKHGFQLPGEINGVADARVHALPAGGAVDVGGVAKQKRASFAEMLRHAVMDVISREPVYLLDLDLEVRNDPAADVLEFERIGVIGAFIPHCPDKPRTPLSCKRKHGEEVGLVEIDMEIAVDRGT